MATNPILSGTGGASKMNQNPLIRRVLLAILCAVTWSTVDFFIATGLNRFLGHFGLYDWPGWTICEIVRVVLAYGVVRAILRLPNSVPKTVKNKASGVAGGKLFDPLLGLRALACWMVLFGHYFAVIFAAPKAQHGIDLSKLGLGLLNGSPWGGVWVFFTLSGYLMGKGFAKGRYELDGSGIRRFYRNRLLRIFPIYFAATLILGTYLQPWVFLPKNWWQLISVCIFDYRGDISFNAIGALWSVSTEVQFYLLAPFLFSFLLYCRRRLSGRFAFLPILFFALFTAWRFAGAQMSGSPFASQYALTPDGANLYNFVYYPGLLGNLDLFLVGMSLNLLPRGFVVRRLTSKGGLIAIGCCLYFVVSIFTAGYGRFHLSFNGFLSVGPGIASLLTSIFILHAESASPMQMRAGTRSLTMKILQWTGVLAYSLYVFHQSILVTLRSLLPAGGVPTKTAILYVPLSLSLIYALAYFFYWFVESPFEKRKHVPDGPLTDAP